MNKNIITIIIVVILVAGGYFLYQNMASAPALNQNNQPTNAPQDTTTQDQDNGTGGQMSAGVDVLIPKTWQVNYTDAGYSPSTLTIKAGDTVMFKNESSVDVWTASAMHPEHVLYSNTSLSQHCPDVENDDFDQCQSRGAGTSWSFTFNKTGAFGYHNHMKATHFGKIIIE